MVDKTNIPNPWQGTLRFAPFNLDLLGAAIHRDQESSRFSSTINVRVHLGITCLDQTPDVVEVIEHGESISMPTDHLVMLASRCVSAVRTMVSRGPTRTTLSVWNARSLLQ